MKFNRLLLLAFCIMFFLSCNPMLNKSNTNLHDAALFGRADIVEAHLDDGADIGALDYSKRTPLHCAAQGGSLEVVKLLVKRGADINATGLNGWTPLFTAVYGTNPREVVEELVNLGADVSVVDVNGDKASDIADKMHDHDTASYLRSHGG